MAVSEYLTSIMRRFISIAAFLLTCSAASAAGQEANPSLSETLKWLHEKLASEGTFTSDVITFGIEPTSFEGCVTKWKSSLGGVSSNTSYAQNILFLSDLDSSKVVAESTKLGNVFSVKVESLMDKSAITQTLLNGLGSPTKSFTLPHYTIYVRSADGGVRIAKAFQHAIKLCQATREPF
jgi:hypothetical protein